MLQSKKNIKYALILLVFAGLAFVINFFTPLHSDDFFYKMRGVSLVKQWEHYMDWSGRLVANFISPSIFLLENKTLIAIAQSLGLIALFHYLSQLPEMATQFESKSPKYLKFILISSLFWLFHPALGHATFWVTGSANYMWTNLIICVYLVMLLNYYYKKKLSYGLFFLALIAGCSNENTSPIVIGFTFLLLLSNFFIYKKIDVKIGLAFVLNTFGGLFLVLSPGNKIRLMRIEEISGTNWTNLSLSHKLSKFDSNFWEALKYPIIFLTLLYLIIYLTQSTKFFNKDHKISFFSISIIFALGAFASDFMMFLSPQYPPRSMSGAFIFLLIAISFALSHIIQLAGKQAKVKHLYYAFTLFFLFLFGKEYFTNILPLYNSAFQQNKVQLTIIKDLKEENQLNVKIPRIHIESDYPHRIVFDQYEEPTAYAAYYGFDETEFYSVDFDFSKLTQNHNLVKNKKLMTENGVQNVYMYSTRKKTHFAIELSKKEVESLKENYHLFFHIYDSNNNLNNFDVGAIKPAKYKDKYFIIIHADFKAKNIKKINFGYFEATDWRIRYAELTIDEVQ